MRPDQGRQRIVKVTSGIIRITKRAVRKDIRSKLEVQQPTLQVHKLGSQTLIARREDSIGTASEDPVEEDVDGNLKTALRSEEQVLWCKHRKGLNDADADKDEEKSEGELYAGRDSLDREVMTSSGGA